jgi:preprotein translocase subunit SecE
MSKIGSYIENAYDELLHKVTWPTWEELQQTTGIVLAGVLLITMVIFLMDGVCETLFQLLYSAFKAKS